MLSAGHSVSVYRNYVHAGTAQTLVDRVHRGRRFDLEGKGAFGQVIKCLDHKHNELVAIKLVKNHNLLLLNPLYFYFILGRVDLCGLKFVQSRGD